jgi:uncharacterized protein
VKKYRIAFAGLKQGSHLFDYEIDSNFFERFEYSPLHAGSLMVRVEVIKQDVLLILNFGIKGYVRVTCDRCLEEYDQYIEGGNRLIVKFGEETYEESDEIVVINRDEQEIDITQFIYEFINLQVPLKKVHPVDAEGHSLCNKEVLRKLDELSSGEESGQIDPRWEALKKLYRKN